MATKRILVVDDEPAVQEVIQGCLELIAGWEVLLANSGKQGLAIATKEKLDAILLDISMPDMDGITTVTKLRENPVTSQVPVAFLTARIQPIDQPQFIKLGVAGLITKPFLPQDLIYQITNLFGWEPTS